MSELRHRSRHIHKTLCDIVAVQLAVDGWINAPINYGATAVTVVEIEPQVAGQKIAPNTVAVTMESESPDSPAEMGAGLTTITMQLFVDVYAESTSICKAICDDVKRRLTGLRTPVMDYTLTSPMASDHFIEIDDVHIDEPPAGSQVDKQTWRVVTCSVEVFFLNGISDG